MKGNVTKKIVRNYDGCKVTLVFGENNSGMKERVLGLLLENYLERISNELAKEQKMS